MPPAPQSIDEMKKKTAEKELKDKVAKLNKMARDCGTLYCYRCGKVSGLYKLNLKKMIINHPTTNVPMKIYVCNYCEGVSKS